MRKFLIGHVHAGNGVGNGRVSDVSSHHITIRIHVAGEDPADAHKVAVQDSFDLAAAMENLQVAGRQRRVHQAVKLLVHGKHQCGLINTLELAFHQLIIFGRDGL